MESQNCLERMSYAWFLKVLDKLILSFPVTRLFLPISDNSCYQLHVVHLFEFASLTEM
jgi:hypothetical protein